MDWKIMFMILPNYLKDATLDIQNYVLKKHAYSWEFGHLKRTIVIIFERSAVDLHGVNQSRLT